MKNTSLNFLVVPITIGKGLRWIEKALFVVVLLSTLVISSCKKDKYTTIVEGTVINVGTQQPIEGVKVVIANEVSFSPSHTDTVITDIDGNFHIELPDENGAWIHLRKSGWTFHSSSLNNVVGYQTSYPEGITSGVKLEMYPDAWFGGVFESTHPAQSDTFYFNELPYLIPISYGGGGVSFSRIGPYDVFDVGGGRDGRLVRGDLYYRFGINYTKNGVWYVKVDSVYVGAFETFTDTIYY